MEHRVHIGELEFITSPDETIVALEDYAEPLTIEGIGNLAEFVGTAWKHLTGEDYAVGYAEHRASTSPFAGMRFPSQKGATL